MISQRRKEMIEKSDSNTLNDINALGYIKTKHERNEDTDKRKTKSKTQRKAHEIEVHDDQRERRRP